MLSNTISARLKKVKEEIDPVMQALAQLEEEPSTTAKGGTAPDIKTLTPLLRVLIQMLTVHDFTALDKFLEISRYLGSDAHRPEVVELRRCIERYKFEAAQMSLQGLSQTLGIEL